MNREKEEKSYTLMLVAEILHGSFMNSLKKSQVEKGKSDRYRGRGRRLTSSSEGTLIVESDESWKFEF